MELHAAGNGDYATWLDQRSDGEYDEVSHGIGRNSWDPRPNHLDEHEHPTNWTTNRALEFLERRDPTRPFFLTLSYHRPHQPFDALPEYWHLYHDRDLPDPVVGDWVEDWYGEKLPKHPATDAWCADLPEWIIERARAGYYGNITHIDHQLNRVLTLLGSLDELSDTLLIYTADHGEMIGDHHLWRKTYAYEGSARVPLLFRFPDTLDLPRGQLIDQPVGLEDIMPTVLEAAESDIPDTVEGRSLFELIEAPTTDQWRSFYHGEHGPIYDDENACQWIVDTNIKYVWNPINGDELLFDLGNDPYETENLADDPIRGELLNKWRSQMVSCLEGRSEGFVKGDSLCTVEKIDAAGDV